MLFSFYDGELFRIVINYDPYETEGLTAEDLVEVFSATFGVAEKLTSPAKAASGHYGDQEDIISRWQDLQHRFDLTRPSYGSGLSLIGVLKRLEGPAQTAILEANRLDDQEAPQREAALAASREEAARAKLEKARLVNKPKFRHRSGLGCSHALGHDLAVFQFLAIERGVVIEILPQGGDFRSEAGEQSLGPGPRKNFGVHLGIGLGLRRLSLRLPK